MRKREYLSNKDNIIKWVCFGGIVFYLFGLLILRMIIGLFPCNWGIPLIIISFIVVFGLIGIATYDDVFWE